MRWDIYLITDPDRSCGRTHSDVITQAICAGVEVVELRDDTMAPARLVEIGRIVRDVTRSANVALIVGDRVDVALDTDADGVRVDDDRVAAARQAVGQVRMVGCLVTTADEAQRAEKDGADYVLVGPIFGTPDGPADSAPIGARAIGLVKDAVSIPVLAFGGIQADNVGEVMRHAADGVAVTSAIAGSPDIPQAVRELRAAIEAARRHVT